MATKTLHKNHKKTEISKKKSTKKMSFFERAMAYDKYLAECSDEKFDKEMQKGEDLLKKVLFGNKDIDKAKLNLYYFN